MTDFHNGFLYDANYNEEIIGEWEKTKELCFEYNQLNPSDSKQRNAGLEFVQPIKVGNSVWFGVKVIVLPGINIGDDVVIGAGSIVTKDIPSRVIVVGNPCKVIRKITEDDKKKY